MYETKISVAKPVLNPSDTHALTNFFGLLLEWHQEDSAMQESNDANAYKQTQTRTAQTKTRE
jgi:hypothetical protein